LNEERLLMLQIQFDDEKTRSHDLQQKLAEATSQKIELESKLKSSSSSHTDTSNEATLNELKAKIARMQSSLDEELKKNKKFEENIEYLSKCFLF
jgi:hypothetical protein